MLLDRIHYIFIEFGFTLTEISEPNTVRRNVDFDVHGISRRRKAYSGVAYREVNFRRIRRIVTHKPEGANGVFNDLVELRCRLVIADYAEAATARDKETTRATTARENEEKTDGGLGQIRPDAVSVCEHSLEQSLRGAV